MMSLLSDDTGETYMRKNRSAMNKIPETIM